jgi:hypothetical protein
VISVQLWLDTVWAPTCIASHVRCPFFRPWPASPAAYATMVRGIATDEDFPARAPPEHGQVPHPQRARSSAESKSAFGAGAVTRFSS